MSTARTPMALPVSSMEIDGEGIIHDGLGYQVASGLAPEVSAFIASAINSHGEMVELLERMADIYDGKKGILVLDRVSALSAEARALLSSLKGKDSDHG